MTKIWVTKYAMTSGIFVVNADVKEDFSMASYKSDSGWGDNYVHGKDFHLNKEDAISRCEEMKKKRLESLKKQIKNTEALVFK